jgi:hypothetical protein
VLESRVLMRKLGPVREEVAGGWKILYNEELRNLNTSPNLIGVIKSRRIRWVGHKARMGEMGNAYKILVRKLEGKRPLGGLRCRWENSTRTNLWETGSEGVNWMYLAQDRDQWRALVNTVMNIRVA